MTNITIGSDPEFVIMCGDKIENALEIFTRLHEPDYCCECLSPDDDEIENIYDGDKGYYIREVINYFDIIVLIADYDDLAIDTLINAFEGKIEELLKIDKFKEVMLLYDKEYDNNIIDILTQKFTHKGAFEYKPSKYDIVKKILLKESTQILEIYNLLSDKHKKRFNNTIMDNVVDYLSNFESLDELPDKIQEKIGEFIVDNYESDCSSCEMQESYFCSTELGCDGQSILGEMRPKYGNNPLEHFNEILRLMEELNDMLAPEIICHGSDQLQVKAGGYIEGEYENYQLGGHIHIGFDEIQKESPGKAGYILKWIKYPLAIYVGIPLTLIEKTKELTRHSSYGSFGAARNGEKYFGTEFRMPSSWLVSPQITIGALSLAYVVAHDYITIMISDDDKYRNKEFLEKIKTYTASYNKYITLTNVDLVYNIPEIYSKIKQMELYPEYKEYIDYIFDMIYKDKTWESNTNILPRWAELW